MEKMNSNNGDGGDSDNGQLLRDIEEISKALYLHKPSSRPLIPTSNFRSKSIGRTRLSESDKDKKSASLWDWKKPLKALTHMMHHRFRICFFFHVHSIEGLPAYLNDFSLCVHWKRKDEVFSTRAVRIVDGIAEFEETLMHKCDVYGRNGPHNSAKYEAKLFVISASVVDTPEHDIGEHRIDLTRLLPLMLEDLEEGKGSAKWTTSFKLSGKAKGAALNVSFSFMVMKESLVESSGNMNVSKFVNITEKGSSAMRDVVDLHSSKGNGMIQHAGTVPSNVKFGTEMLPNLGLELSKSISILYHKLNEESLHGSSGLGKLPAPVEPLKLDSESVKYIGEYENNDFSVIERGLELCLKDPSTALEQSAIQTVDGSAIEIINVDEILKDPSTALEQSAIQIVDGSAIEIINVDEILKDCDSDIDEEADPVLNMCRASRMEEIMVDDCMQEKSNICSKPLTVQELEPDCHNKLITESSVSESPHALNEFIEHGKFMEVKSHYEASKLAEKSPSLDRIADTVATDFLKMLEIENGRFSFNSDSALESPRERLLREFENEALASGDFMLDFGAEGKEEEFESTIFGPCCGNNYEEFAFSSAVLPCKEHKVESLSLKERMTVEDLETEASMREWSSDEKACQSLSRVQSDGFGSPIMLSPE